MQVAMHVLYTQARTGHTGATQVDSRTSINHTGTQEVTG